MYDRVLELARPSRETRVFDVGTTPDVDISYANFFERWYPYTDQITVCSIEDCSALEDTFEGLRFRQIEGHRLPAADREFDLAVAFAVLEHVGKHASQQNFLGELARVAREFIIYTPYRYFPVEMHTLQPIVHWLPTPWYRTIWRRCGLKFWADEKNLNLLSLRQIRRILPRSGRTHVTLVSFCGVPSNIEVHWRQEA